MSVGKICTRTAYLAQREESVQAAAARMKDENVGTLLVLDAERRPVGIVTDRDLAVRALAPGLDAHRVRVGEVMTAHPRCVEEGTPIEEAARTMRGLGVRRLPVVDSDGRLVGIVSLDDVLELVVEELGNLGRIVASTRPGVRVPATRPAPSRTARPATAGLERSAGDLEC